MTPATTGKGETTARATEEGPTIDRDNNTSAKREREEKRENNGETRERGAQAVPRCHSRHLQYIIGTLR